MNVGGYVWDYIDAGCSGHSYTNTRVWFGNLNHFWDGGNCGPIDTTGSVFGDGTLDPEDYRVLL